VPCIRFTGGWPDPRIFVRGLLLMIFA